MPGPVLPERDGVLERAVEILGLGCLGGNLLDAGGVRVGGDHPRALAGADRAAGPEHMVGRLELRVGRDQQAAAPADGGVEVGALAPDPGIDLAVVEPRGDLDVEVDRAADALDHAEDLRARPGRTLAIHRQAVDDHRLATLDPKARLEHQGLPDVGPMDARLSRPLDRRDLEVAAPLPIEDPAEAAARVEPGKTAPVDRSRA